MFWHLFRNRLKVLFGNKSLLFWTGIFPIVLGTFFYLGFSEIAEKTESLDTIEVVVTDEALANSNEGLKAFLQTMEEQGYFEISYAEYDEAIDALEKDAADGALVLTNAENGVDMSLKFAKNGMNQTILKNMINTYKYGADVIEDTVKNNPQALKQVVEELYSKESVNEELSLNAKDMDLYNQYYFALFAMTCMFGSSFGLFNTQHSQADQSSVAMRRAASPTRKMLIVLSEYLAAVTIMELVFALLVFYLTVVLGINLGDRYGLIAIASFMASLLGVAMGYFIGVVVKGKATVKEGIQIAVVMFSNFLAGLMMGDMKYIIEKNCPIINRINPAAIISDCFYSICAYDDLNLYIRCIVSMGIWIVILATTAIFILRREKYANL